MSVEAVEQDGKFALVQMLAKDLSEGGLDLPSFPDIVVRIRKALADENVTTDQIVQIIGADPVLAARILTIANSAAMRPAADPITDLPMAVNRIGHNMVRNTAVSHGVSQSRNSYTLKEARVYLENLWDECAHVAALCFVLAKNRTRLNADEALLIGLMHGIGKLYILGRAESHPELFGDEADLFDVMDELGFRWFEKQLQESRQPDGPFKGIGNVIFCRPGWEAYEKLYSEQQGVGHVQAAFSYAVDQIASAVVQEEPTPYFFIENVFPEEFYEYLLSQLPADESYTPIDAAGLTAGSAYPERSIFQFNDQNLEKLSGLDRPFWNQLALALLSSDFLIANLQKFAPWLPECRQSARPMPAMLPEALLVRDRAGYKLGPHTDNVDRVLSLLFYLPRDRSLETEGTALYVPVDPDFTCPGGPHHDFDGFTEVKRIPFKPNSLVGFVSTDRSFHGVPEFKNPDAQRDILGYMIKNPERLANQAMRAQP